MTTMKIYPPNDVGSGLRLAERFGDKFRWVTDRRCWVVFDGARWEVQSDDVKVEGIAKKAALLIAQEAGSITDDNDRRSKQLVFAAKSMDMPRIKATVAAAKSVPAIQVRSSDLDADPLLINCANGTFDLRADRLREHDPEDLITRVVPHDYDGSYAPRYQALLRRAFQVDPTAETPPYVEMLLGYCLIGGNPEHVIIFVIGPAGTGKSQLVEVPNAVLGTDYSWVGKPSLITRGKNDAHTEEVVKLGEKRLVVISETDGSMRLDEAAVKSFTGSQRIAVRSLYGKQEQVPLEATIVVATNEAPAIEKFDDAIRRRLIIIRSGPSLAPHEKDVNLQRKIVAEEANGVLTSLINGARRWYALSQRLGAAEGPNDVAVLDKYMPAAVEVETSTFAHDNDPIEEFIDEVLEFGSGYQAPAASVDRAYGDFRRNEGRVGKRRLYERLLDLCEQRGLVEVRKDARNFYGLRVRSTLDVFDGR